jgi:hypothetical protein
LVGVILRWLWVGWLPLTNDGDVTAAPKPLLKLPVFLFAVRWCKERKSVFAII